MRIWQPHRGIPSLSATSLALSSSLELNHLLQLCSKSKALDPGRQLHQQIIMCGLGHDSFMTTKLVQMYADCRDLESAHQLFERLSQPNVFACTSILWFYSQNGMSSECVDFYGETKLRGVVPDGYVFPKVLRACAQSGNFQVGVLVHKDVITFGAELNLQVCNSLIDMYSKCGDVESARRVFDQMVERDLLSWNSMISGYVHNEFLKSAVDLLDSMRLKGFVPDLVTWNTVMDAYCRMGQCDEAWKIFEGIKEPNVVSWTTLISGYSRIGKHQVTLTIFRNMVSKGEVLSDLACISNVIVSCRHLGALTWGREIHAYGTKRETWFAFYKSAGPALLTMYARCKRLRDATNVFNLMDKFDVVSWNAMISSLSDLRMENRALECFRRMQNMGLGNNETTISAALPACDLESGKQMHAYILRSSFSPVIAVWNALIHMYSRCGHIEAAYSVFSNMASRDFVSWNTMIGGFGMHGSGRAALQLLQQMSHSGLCPDSTTFTSVLSACSHSGLLHEGLQVFRRMTKELGINPGAEHYACVVDLLARAGCLEDAVGFIKAMPVEADGRVWGAVLAAAQAHQNVRVAMLASQRLVHLEPGHAGHYVTLANMYARVGRWDDAVRVRKGMESRGLVKPSGYSWVETGNLH
ncbi:pentatricopeptide repeat-containing protein At3g09040, mitochondrial-like [Diospyros lotus]|uniref:pentatricopeptide repeat-containing protein At3g09040, mitochondrial-like n=1 Tax=Diospyros lotus TaxID=55363 RepID=UPI00225C2013|nr:pentatricopeptide repeat-containing protein At3g09040, mitochondrial-like [Diospyros lotus]